MLIDEYFKNYKPSQMQLEHALKVADLSIKIYLELKNIYKNDPKLEFKNALKLLSYASKLHDIGMFFERVNIDKPHNKTGAKLVLENKIDDLDENEIKVIAASIRYHRGSKPKEKHRLYSSLCDEDKNKVLAISSILRLADALDLNHIGIVEKINITSDSEKHSLTLNPFVNIMFNRGLRNVFNKKKTLFEEVFDTKINLTNV